MRIPGGVCPADGRLPASSVFLRIVPPVERAARAYDCWLRVVQQHRSGFDAARCGLTESERADVALLERLLLPSLFEEAGFAYMRDVVAAVNGYRHACCVL